MTELEIRRLDPHDDADMDAFQDVYAAAERAEDPEAHLYSRDDGIAMLTSKDGGFDLSTRSARSSTAGWSASRWSCGFLRDNLDLAQLLLWVDPAHQRQGVGTRLLTHAEEHARSQRTHPRPGAGPDRSRPRQRQPALRREAGVPPREHRDRAAPGAPRRRATSWTRLEAEAAPHHRDYEIRRRVGPVPEELRASYVALDNLLVVEMPHGDLERGGARNTVADLDALERERERRRSDPGRAYAVARRASSSRSPMRRCRAEMLATSTSTARWSIPPTAATGSAWRSSARQLRLLSEHFPDKHYLRTTNAETNAHMVAINEALGFAVHHAYGEFQKRLV